MDCCTSDPAGAIFGCRRASPAPAARHDRRRRSRDVASGAVAPDPRGVLVLAVWRDRGIGTAGVCQRRALRERASSDDDVGALRGRGRRRLDRGRAAAARRGERALRPTRRSSDGVFRLGSARRQRWSPVSPRTGDCLGLPGLSGKLAHSRGPPRRRDGGRPLHRAALRDPAARKRAGASRARDCGQQHHQCARHGDRRGRGRCPAGTRFDDGRTIRAVRTADHPRRARGGVDPAANDGEEPRAIDPQNPLPREGGGARARACGAPEGGDRRQSLVVSRWIVARGIPAWRADFRRRHTDLQAVVGEAVPRVRQRAAGRSDESALHPRDDPSGGSRLGLRHFSGRPHHDDRIVDESVRRARGHRRAHEGRASTRAHRRCGVHAVLSPGRQGPSTPVSADSPAHPAAAPADGARGCDRPRPPRRLAPRARRRDGAVDVRRRSHRHDALRRAASTRVSSTAAATSWPTTSRCVR